jgi:hypothetical protein
MTRYFWYGVIAITLLVNGSLIAVETRHVWLGIAMNFIGGGLVGIIADKAERNLVRG